MKNGFERGVDYSMYGLFGINYLNTGVIIFHNDEVVETVKDYGFKKIRTIFGITFAISFLSREV